VNLQVPAVAADLTDMAQKVQPLVSVLVPTYNGERYLDETLLSVRKQTHRHMEILVRDDGSSDATVEIAKAHAAQDRRIEVIEADVNGGGIVNFTELVRMARGRFIKFCNQDDLIAPRCVEVLARAMVQHPNVTIATSRRRLINADGVDLGDAVFTAPLVSVDAVVDGTAALRHMLLASLNQIGEPSTVMFRNGALDPDRLFDLWGITPRVNGDIAMWIQLLDMGDLYYHRSEILSSFRIHDSQVSAGAHIEVLGSLEWGHILAVGIERGIVAWDDRTSGAIDFRINQLRGFLEAGSRFAEDLESGISDLERLREVKQAQFVPIGTGGF
jgi:glycosyltransferase involved in cell wall biosynthesis